MWLTWPAGFKNWSSFRRKFWIMEPQLRHQSTWDGLYFNSTRPDTDLTWTENCYNKTTLLKFQESANVTRGPSIFQYFNFNIKKTSIKILKFVRFFGSGSFTWEVALPCAAIHQLAWARSLIGSLVRSSSSLLTRHCFLAFLSSLFPSLLNPLRLPFSILPLNSPIFHQPFSAKGGVFCWLLLEIRPRCRFSER